MANKFGAADFEPHLLRGLTITYLLDWATAATTLTVLEGGHHPKLRLARVLVQNVNAALNATEPIINIQHGGSEVVATVDMATAMAATAAVGYVAELTIIDTYRHLAADDAITVEVETADGGATTRGLMTFEYEAVE